MGNLVITRTKGKSFTVGEVSITIVEAKGGRVRLAIKAPRSIPVERDDCINRDPKPAPALDHPAHCDCQDCDDEIRGSADLHTGEPAPAATSYLPAD